MDERSERLKKLVIEMDGLVRDTGPKLIRLAHLRREAAAIMEEIKDVKVDE